MSLYDDNCLWVTGQEEREFEVELELQKLCDGDR